MPSGYDSMLPVQEMWVQSLVRKLRSCMPRGMAKKLKKKKKEREREKKYRVLNIKGVSVGSYHANLKK